VIVLTRKGDLRVPVLVDDDFQHRGRLSIASHGYVQMTPPGTGRVMLLHRWLLGLAVGDPRKGDHVNRDVLDNRRCNLRAVDGSTSNANRAKLEIPTTCTYRMRDRWQARIRWRGQLYHLGTFRDREDAAAAVAAFRAEHPETMPPRAAKETT
jgi:hypothetical protein